MRNRQSGGFLGIKFHKDQEEVDRMKQKWGNFKQGVKDFGRRTSDSLKSGISSIGRKTSDTINALKGKYKDWKETRADKKAFDLDTQSRQYAAKAALQRISADRQKERDRYVAEQKSRRSSSSSTTLGGRRKHKRKSSSKKSKRSHKKSKRSHKKSKKSHKKKSTRRSRH